jgi:hypothetical protein
MRLTARAAVGMVAPHLMARPAVSVRTHRRVRGLPMRSRRNFWSASALLLGIVLVAGGTLAALVRHEPAFYRAAEVPPSQERKKLSFELLQKLISLDEDARTKTTWAETITEEELNSHFAEDPFCILFSDRRMPERFHEPRVVIEPEKMTLAVRYGSGTFSTVLSVEVDAWLPAHEVNVIALRLRGLHAGKLPWSTQSLLDHISDGVRQSPLNMDVTWCRDRGDPVALLRPRDDIVRPTFLLQRLELCQGYILIEGTTELPANPKPAGSQVALRTGGE